MCLVNRSAIISPDLVLDANWAREMSLHLRRIWAGYNVTESGAVVQVNQPVLQAQEIENSRTRPATYNVVNIQIPFESCPWV